MKNFSYVIDTVRLVLSDSRYLVLFLIVFLVTSILYGYLLLSSATGIIDFGAYYVLFDLVSTISISFLMAIVITINIYAFKLNLGRTGKIGFLSIVSAILPSTLCCTSVVPSIMAIIGWFISDI